MADRPPTNKGLGVIGKTPPTAAPRTSSGPTARLATGAAGRTARGATARTAGGTAVDPLAQDLILKYRLKFGEAGSSLQGQEAIAQEVLAYAAVAPQRPAKMRAIDLAKLEDRIRLRLVGGTPGKQSLVAAKAGEYGDEWLSMFQFGLALGEAKTAAEVEAARARQAVMREALRKQLEEQERVKAAERAQEEAYFRAEQEAIRRGEEQEAARRRLQAEIMIRLKHERIAQMEERISRRDAALTRRRKEESVDAARTAYETAEELRREEEQRHEAKMALREFLAANEGNKALREAAKKAQWDEDAAFQRKWEAILNKQEADRREQMERIKVHQAKLQAAADRQAENKRPWLPTPLVNRYYQEREDARAAEEEARVAKLRQTALACTAAVGEQLRERQEAKARQRADEEAFAASVAAKVAAAEAAERARKEALAAKKLAFRASIEEQMRASAARKLAEARPMTDVERAINRGALEAVGQWQTTGRLPDLGTARLTASLTL
ncbi:hypothetical protein HYH03_015347 [Edaphochlamys debaryana]|uniref:Uncharacterized protein n=1 Tax=Edaphochlamys debaryana TaxID=47281 RepID=A0A835XN94_9CHLO|nr:hypothetical protein HYH03_015347 [Edaphochlamys debaryana]|eukprot:KAG2485903.1 hypothetical protein HYH03_015347 [Edaphochlamys debaryana]